MCVKGARVCVCAHMCVHEEKRKGLRGRSKVRERKRVGKEMKVKMLNSSNAPRRAKGEELYKEMRASIQNMILSMKVDCVQISGSLPFTSFLGNDHAFHFEPNY